MALNNKQFKEYKLRPHWDKTGQGMLFSPRVGTGMHTDPISRERRLKLSRSIAFSNGGPVSKHPFGPFGKEDVAQALFKSKMPLQHLSDLDDKGLSIELQEPQHMSGTVGTFYYGDFNAPIIDINENKAHPRIIGHEVGHARHATLHPQVFQDSEEETDEAYNNYVDTGINEANPIKEGIAEGYARRNFKRQSWQPKVRYGKLFTGSALTDYKNALKHVRTTGDIPIGTNREISHALTEQYGPKIKQRKHPQLPGMEGL